MNTRDLIKASFKVLRVNRKRTFLTMLGIIIGISAVIIIMSVGAGAQSLILDQISVVGSDMIGILPGYSEENAPPTFVFGVQITTLKKEDIEALHQISELKYVSGYVQSNAPVQYGNESIDTNFIGAMASYQDTQSINLIQGNFFEESDEEGISRVVVLGWQIWQDLFNGGDVLGEKVKIKKENFRVIGVVEKRGVQGFENQDDLVFIPLGTAQKLLLGINYLQFAEAKAQSEADVPYAVTQIKEILRERHNIDDPSEDDFTVSAVTQALEALTNITNALKFFLSAIAAVSLLVGGVGIMNIMLVSVNERTREIGLRKAIGATKIVIQNQFLIEAIVLTALGGVVGTILGISFSGLIAVVANYLGYNWDFVVTIPSIILGVGVSALVGIIFGWYPAKKASSLEPVEALRYE